MPFHLGMKHHWKNDIPRLGALKFCLANHPIGWGCLTWKINRAVIEWSGTLATLGVGPRLVLRWENWMPFVIWCLYYNICNKDCIFFYTCCLMLCLQSTLFLRKYNFFNPFFRWPFKKIVRCLTLLLDVYRVMGLVRELKSHTYTYMFNWVNLYKTKGLGILGMSFPKCGNAHIWEVTWAADLWVGAA